MLGLPVIGSIPFLQRQMHLQLSDMQKQYGDIFCFGYGSKFMVVLNNYETVKKVLADERTTGRDQQFVASEVFKKDGTLHGALRFLTISVIC